MIGGAADRSVTASAALPVVSEKDRFRAACCERGGFDCLNPPLCGDAPRLSKHRKLRRTGRFIAIVCRMSFKKKRY
jgi:hypothetical protein